ncbi:MAG: hypothetical protein P8Z76_08815 [Alphaproteobacteria bacterium]
MSSGQRIVSAKDDAAALAIGSRRSPAVRRSGQVALIGRMPTTVIQVGE